MKKIVILLFLAVIFNSSIGQNLNGYKYVYVETLKYRNGRTDIWGISKKLKDLFEKKGFTVINNASQVNLELKQDPCLLLICYINHSNNIGSRNNVTITLKNCKSKIVYQQTGHASGWSDKAFEKATVRAFDKIQQQIYSFNNKLTPKIEYPKVEKTKQTEETLKEYYSRNKLNQIEGIYKSYQLGNSPYYEIGIKKQGDRYIAIILDAELNKIWKQGEVKAYFEPSSMNGLYSVKWYMSDKTPQETFATIEDGGILSVELKNPQSGEKMTYKFIKMYPPLERDKTFKGVQKSFGSGFFLTSKIIATNAHVIENAKTIKVQISNEKGTFEYSAKVLLKDNNNDVALIKIVDSRFKGVANIPYSFVEKAEIGENVFTIGYPLSNVMGTNYKVTNGIISSLSGINEDMRYYQITVPLQPGNSGGPLFDSNGDVIGITSARLNGKAVGTSVENVNYAIKISYLLNLYEMLPNSGKLNTKSTQSTKDLQEQVKILKNYVCLIKVN